MTAEAVDYNSMAEPEFRAMIREFVSAHFPKELLDAAFRVGPRDVAYFNRKMSERGWIAPSWPVQWGGMGLDVAHHIAFIEELGAIGVPRLHEMGLVMLGPILLKFGTEEQKRKYLPKIVSTEHVWCQGCSEPNAGSDLASLRLSAVRDGDHWVLNGQKIWTTMAHQSNMMFMLVRTNAHVQKRQDGISFLLVDLASPGIEVRSIRTLSDELEFCEVFFSNVRVPGENLVGEVDKGWTVAKALLGHERLFVGSSRYVQGTFARLGQLAQERGVLEDATFRDHYLRLKLDFDEFIALYSDYANFAKNSGELGAEASILKLISSDILQRVSEEMVDIMQEDGVTPPAGSNSQAEAITHFFQSRPSSIAGGTSQVQRGIIAKAVLGLPS